MKDLFKDLWSATLNITLAIRQNPDKDLKDWR